MSVSTPYQFVSRGNLFITPVGPSIADAPYPTQPFTKPPDYSLWVHGQILEPGLYLDRARMSPSLYREVRDDLTRYAPVEVTRSAFRRAEHAYVGVIDSRGTPYYFALDSRGVSVREAPTDAAWKAFDRLADDEHMAAVRQRRVDAAEETRRIDRELSEPVLIITKGLKYGKKVEWKHDVPHSSWWRNIPKERGGNDESEGDAVEQKPKKEPKPKASESKMDAWRVKYPSGRVTRQNPKVAKGSKIPNGRAKGKRRSDFDQKQLRVGSQHELEHTSDQDVASRIAMDHLVEDPDYYIKLKKIEKALPKNDKNGDVKMAPTSKASKKQAGAGGKTRYTYPQEKNKPKVNPGPDYVPLVVVHDDTKHADPSELANQLGVSVRTLQRCARKLGGDEFAKFMRSHLKRFAAKHRLDPDYWGTLYANLVVGGDVVKSDHDAAWKEFGDNVNRVASSVPEGHHERFGRKVFIHHVHDEMKRHGLYSGGLDEFKRHLVHAHKEGHVELSRADLVGAMDPKSVDRSHTSTGSGHAIMAHFNFVNAEHNPGAASKLAAREKLEAPKHDSPKASSKRGGPKVSPHLEAANKTTDAAIAASNHAHKVGTSEAHLAAMSAHHQAGAAHQKATGKINSKVALAHFDQSTAHLKAAKAAGS